MSKEQYPFGEEGWNPKRLGFQDGKTFVITGGNSGAGFEATKLLVSKGAKVVMVTRNAKRARNAINEIKEEVPNADILFIQMDLASLDSVRKAAKQIKEYVPRIDALICNAAIAQVAKQEVTVDGFESQIGINHYGHFLLCGLLFDLVEASNGRIVVVGSTGYRMGLKKIQFEDLNFDHNYNAMKTYCHSKLAQMVFAYELQKRVKEKGRNVQVYICHPGASRTNLAKKEAGLVTKVLFKLLSPLAQSAEHGSWPEVLCSTENNLEDEVFYGPTKRNEMVGPIGKSDLQAHTLDRDVASRFWTISEEKTGFTWNL